MKKKDHDEQNLIEKRRRNYSYKKGGESLRKNITEEISKLKRAETVEIKKMREESLSKIQSFRENLLKSKKQQYLKVKSSENLTKLNIQDFWERKKSFFTNVNRSIRNENEQISLKKEKEIYELERMEEDLIHRLEKSQNVDEMAIKQLEEVMVTPLEDFIEKYGEKKTEKKITKKMKRFDGLPQRGNNEKEINLSART